MPLFPFKSNAHFVTSSDGTILQVYELTKPTNQLPFVKKADWKQVTTITASLEEEDDDKSYNGLAFFDGHGKIEGEKALTTLAQHLKQLHLLVNPKGYCFQDVSDLGMYSDFGIHYLRLNDLFSWPCHKIDLTTSNVWGRLELKYNSPSKRQGPSPKSSKPSVGGGVSKEKYAKLEMLVKEKDEELEKLKEEKKMKDEEEAKTQRIEELEKLNEDLEEANRSKDEELQKLAKSKNVGELQRQLKKKDDELRILKKKKDDEDAKTKRIEELEKLNEELEDATKAKEEELQKLKQRKPNEGEIRKILKKKEVELRALKSKKDDEEEKSRRIEELEKTIEEMEVANMARDEELLKLKKGKNEELQKALREKNHELRVLEKKKEDEKNNAEAKAKKAEGELQEVKDKLSFSVDEVEQVNKELEQCRKLSWAILPSTSFLPQSADAKEKYLTRRQRIAPEKLVCNALLSFPYVTNSPKLVDNMYNWSSNRVRLVDEESSSSTWPAPPNLDIRIGRGVLDFDRNNWWYVKTTHPEGGLTMLVYYDGNQSQLTLASPSCIVPLPYAKGVEFITYTYRLSLFDLTPLGFRLGFTYRPA
ncbi:hypothetical protein LINGRAHAP2_LOCUS8140 [Linum grandiflorum]